jgi:hypothetical protein
VIDLAADGTPVDPEFACTLSMQAKLVLTAHEVYLPKPKLAIDGPGGVQASFDFRGAKNDVAGRMLTVTLTTSTGWCTDDQSQKRAQPYELELPYGLRVTVRPLTTAGMAAAQAAALRAVEAIERQARERVETGLALDGLPDLSAEGERDGFYQTQLIRELAVRHITSWTGVELGGGPAPPTPENIAAVMELYPVGERFFQEFTLRQVLLNVWTPPALQARSLIVRHEQGRLLQCIRPLMRPRGRWPR